VMDKLASAHPRRVNPWRDAVGAAALLHDIGHIAPGSHTAQKAWFPGQPDRHEEITTRIVGQDPEIAAILRESSADLPARIAAALSGGGEAPPWTHALLSAGGWNIDRGNWCMLDSIMAGVSYGQYNIAALTDSLDLTGEDRLALRENRLDAMIHFAVSRHALYSQLYQHRVLLSCDMLTAAIVRRARDLGGAAGFADPPMQAALAARAARDLSLDTVFQMREPWWRYHLCRWSAGPDPVLADLAGRMLNRRLFKTVRVADGGHGAELAAQARRAVIECGFDPAYYLGEVSTEDVHAGDSEQSLAVLMDHGALLPLDQSAPIFRAMLDESQASSRRWLVMPEEAKRRLGRRR